MNSMVDLKVDTRGLNSAIRSYAATTKKDAKEIVDQRALNVARWTFEAIPPSDPRSKRSEIKEYMDRIIELKIRFSRKKKQFVARGRKHHLRVKHLIAQYRQKQAGKPGLQGKELGIAAGKISAGAQGSVGYVKSVLLPIFETMNKFVKFKMPVSKTRNIARWPGSAGHGSARPARLGWNAVAQMETSTPGSKPGDDARIAAVQLRGVRFGIQKEEREIVQHTAKKLRQSANNLGIKTV